MVPRPRSDLHAILVDILGSSNVYFQPPPTVKLNYPCIIYELENMAIQHANNNPYRHLKRYSVTAVDQNPDSEIADKLAYLPTVQFSRAYGADYLHHTTYRLYF